MPSVRRARRADLPAIVELHLISLPGFFLTSPGPAFLRCFYSLMLRDHRGLLFVSEQEGALAGFVAGFADPAYLYPKLPAGRFRLLAAAAGCLLRHPMQFPGLVRDVHRLGRLARRPDRDSGPVCEFITIAVQPQFRRQGHGKTLARALAEAARSHPMMQVRVKVESGDKGMCLFYRKLGFEPCCAERASGSQCMDEYVLTPQGP
jgi:ribosomal protein S18 acetylase RimI-like enzyme